MAFPNQPVIDSCVRADENPISLGGLWTGGITSMKLASNTMQAASSSGFAGWVNIATSADVEFYLTMSTLPTTEVIFLIFRGSSPATQGNSYVLGYTGSVDGHFYCARYDAGVATTLGYESSPGLLDGDSFGVSMTGSAISAYYRASGVWNTFNFSSPISDSTYPAAGYFTVLTNGTVGRYTTIGAGPVSSVPPGGGSGIFSGAAVPSGHSIDRGLYKAMARGIGR